MKASPLNPGKSRVLVWLRAFLVGARPRFSAGNTFAAISKELIEKNEKEGKSQVTLKKKQWMLDMANACFGPTPIVDVKAADILVPLKKLEVREKYETANRLKAVIGQVFRYAVATGRAEYDPTSALKGALITGKVSHQAAITSKEPFLKLVQDIWAYTGSPSTVTALKLMVLLYPRPGELRKSEWSEFDLEEAIWTVPAERTKMRRTHVKPMSDEAMKILHEYRQLTGLTRKKWRGFLLN